MEWFTLLFPILTGLISFFLFRTKILWWETIIPTAICALFILIFKISAKTYLTTDTEYWSGYVIDAEHYEAWNEKVACSHPKYCEETYTDSNGKTKTREYQCGWQHAYDVDYHPEYWEKTDNNGICKQITSSEYSRVKQVLGNESFVNMHRNYHTIDGDKYICRYTGGDEQIDIMCHDHYYTNKIQASHSVFNFKSVSKEEKIKWSLYEYPLITYNNKQRHILGCESSSAERQMEILNAKLGRQKQVKAFICVYKNKPVNVAHMQEQYWKGGNKNEVIVCIGVDNYNTIEWVHIISWNKNKTLNINIRNYILEQNKLDLFKISNELYVQIERDFVRQPFKEFSYLKVDLTTTQFVWLWIITILLSIGGAAWAILNKYEQN